jgi:hypothetical protein
MHPRKEKQVMFIRFVVVAMLAASLLPTAGSAQTAAELLQKGIYTQQTAGDMDGAIKIFQQVVAMPGADRATAARAQMQLVSAFLLKGDLPGASREFSALTLNYGDQKEVVSAMAAAIRMVGSMGLAQGSPTPAKLTRGTLENGVYHNTKIGVEIRLLDGWSITGDGGSPDGAETVGVRDPSGHPYFVWMLPESTPAAEIPAALDWDMNQKVHQRTVAGIKDFKVRPETVFKYHGGTPPVGGVRHALAVGYEFERNGTPLIEYDTWIRTEKTKVLISYTGPASTIANVYIGEGTLVNHTDLP